MDDSTHDENGSQRAKAEADDFLGRRQALEAQAEEGDALFEWLLAVTREFPREEALEMFLQKLMVEQMSRPTVNWALDNAVDNEAVASVISEGIATMDRTRPVHWFDSEGDS